MYLAHWGLERSPFALGGGAPLFFEGETQSEALARLRFVVRHGRRLAVVVGPSGVGRSALLRQFAEQCRREGRPVACTGLAGISKHDLLWQLASQLSLGPRPGDDATALFNRMAAFAESLRWQRAYAALLLDDAEQAGPDVRAVLVRLLALGADDPRLTFAVTTTHDQAWQLGRELLDVAELRIDLEPWSETETVGYVQHALIEAGCERPALDDEALSVLYTLTGGVPRDVNRLADHALLGAAAEGRETVDAAVIEAARDALNWAASA